MRFFLFVLTGFVVTGLAGCQFGRTVASGQVQTPILVRGNNLEQVWEQTIDVLHNYNFEIARENKQDGVIETKYKIGASLAEPWHKDSVGFYNRLESTMQSIRRRVFVSVTATDDGFLVNVEAFKELEDLVGLAANSAGGATFQEAAPLQRDLNVVVGQTTPSGWVDRGHDTRLERDMMARLAFVFGR